MPSLNGPGKRKTTVIPTPELTMMSGAIPGQIGGIPEWMMGIGLPPGPIGPDPNGTLRVQRPEPMGVGMPLADPTWPPQRQEDFGFQQRMAEGLPAPYEGMVSSMQQPQMEDVPEESGFFRRLATALGAGLMGQPGLALGVREEQRRERKNAENRNLLRRETWERDVQNLAVKGADADNRIKVAREKAEADIVKAALRADSDKKKIESEEKKWQAQERGRMERAYIRANRPTRTSSSSRETPDEKDYRDTLKEMANELEALDNELYLREKSAQKGTAYEPDPSMPDFDSREEALKVLTRKAKMKARGRPEVYDDLMATVLDWIDSRWPEEKSEEDAAPAKAKKSSYSVRKYGKRGLTPDEVKKVEEKKKRRAEPIGEI